MSRRSLSLSFLLLFCFVLLFASLYSKSRKYACTRYSRIWREMGSDFCDGSSISATETLRWLLPYILKSLDIMIFLDAGCGNLNWIKRVPLPIDYYIGIDIVEKLIEENKEKYSSDWTRFYCLDITKDFLPNADLIFCRDCLQYLSFHDIKLSINNFKKSGSTYLMATSYFNVYQNSYDVNTGSFHLINLMKEPFNLPEPIISFDELSAEEEIVKSRKRMCVWKLSDIQFFVCS